MATDREIGENLTSRFFPAGGRLGPDGVKTFSATKRRNGQRVDRDGRYQRAALSVSRCAYKVNAEAVEFRSARLIIGVPVPTGLPSSRDRYMPV